ncbi:unnamed protein product [Linum trigynum]
MTQLQDDLLVEILARLPDARSAFRCRPICKRWRSLISDPLFRRRFLSHKQSESGGYSGGEQSLVLSSHDAQSVTMSFLPVPDDLRPYFSVLSSCEDLVLCGFDVSKKSGGDDQDESVRRMFFVCNPFTKQWVALPLAPAEKDRPFSTVSLVCQSDGKVRAFIDRFRVVCFSGSGYAPDVDLFCSESGEWTKYALNPNRGKRLQLREQLLTLNEECFLTTAWFNGKLHWQTIAGHKIYVWDPFRPDAPTTFMDGKLVDLDQVWISQGALYIVNFTQFLYVWRLGERDGDITGRKLYASVPLKACKFVGSNSEKYSHLKWKLHGVCALHPNDPDIVFLEFSHRELCTRPQLWTQRELCTHRVLFSLNIRTAELTFVAEQTSDAERWRVFHPRFTCWPSPIPNYEKLQGAFHGSYTRLVHSIESARARTSTTHCHFVEQLGRRPRKHSRSPSPQPLRNPAKKQKMVEGRGDQLVEVVHALQAIPDMDEQLMLDACDFFEDDDKKAAMFLALDGRFRKEWLLRKLCPKDSV